MTITLQIVVVLVIFVTIVSVLMYSLMSTLERQLVAECLELARKYKLNPEDYMTLEELMGNLELAIDRDWDATISDMEV